MNWWEYLILVNVYLVLFFGFYALLLKRETFFQLNRLYLVSAALLSFLMPLIQSSWIKGLFITQTVHATIYSSPVIAYQFKPVADTPITIGELLGIIYLVGVGLLLLRFGWQLISLSRIMKSADAAPYTFFKKVKVDNSLTESDIIATHEQVHATQLHSADVMIIEAVMIVNWFNPVVYFYRFAIKHIHEFIADSYTLRSGTNKADYAMLLLNQSFNAPQHQLVSNFFNRTLLKQRIIMLQKNRSARIKLIKYGFSAPLFILMLIISAATVNTSKAVAKVNFIARDVMDLPADKITTVKLMPPPDEGATAAALSPQAKANALKAEKLDTSKITQVVFNNDDTTHNEVFTAVEVEPTFPGNFGAFLGKNIHYPKADKDNNVQGKVFLQFVVEKDGSLSDIKVLRSPSKTLAEESIRVLSLSPKWHPGLQNGKPVRVMYTVPISYTLSQDDDKTKKASSLEPVTVTGHPLADTTKVTAGKFFEQHAIADALIYVDDKETSFKDMQLIDPKTIESVTVLKDASATTIYGEKGKNGVILIKLKKKN